MLGIISRSGLVILAGSFHLSGRRGHRYHRMGLHNSIPGSSTPFQAEMAALKEVERQRLIRLVQVFCVLTFGVYSVGALILLLLFLVSPGFYNFTLLLSLVMNLPVSIFCH